MRTFSIIVALPAIILLSCGSMDRALQFNGTDTYVNLGNIYDDIQLPVTVSAWINVKSIAQYAPIFISQDNLPGYTGFMIMATPRGIAIQYGDGQGENHHAYRRGKSANTPSLINRWVYVTGVIRGAQDMDLFLNGQKLEGTYSGSSDLPMESNSPGEVAKIGYWFSNDIESHFNGSIDNLNIWNKALSEDEIKETMCSGVKGNETGLVGFWNFDEKKGIVLDKSPAKFNGSISGVEERIKLTPSTKPSLCNN